MTNTSESMVNGLDCIEAALDMGFIPMNEAAVLMATSRGVYKHSSVSVSLFVEDLEGGEFVVRVYRPINIVGLSHLGPEIYRTTFTNLPLAVFKRQLAGLLEDAPFMD